MFSLKIFVRIQTFRRVLPVLPCNFCHPALPRYLRKPVREQANMVSMYFLFIFLIARAIFLGADHDAGSCENNTHYSAKSKAYGKSLILIFRNKLFGRTNKKILNRPNVRTPSLPSGWVDGPHDCPFGWWHICHRRRCLDKRSRIFYQQDVTFNLRRQYVAHQCQVQQSGQEENLQRTSDCQKLEARLRHVHQHS